MRELSVPGRWLEERAGDLGECIWKVGGQEMESFQGWGEVGGIMPVGAGIGNYSWSLVCSPEEGGLA